MKWLISASLCHRGCRYQRVARPEVLRPSILHCRFRLQYRLRTSNRARQRKRSLFCLRSTPLVPHSTDTRRSVLPSRLVVIRATSHPLKCRAGTRLRWLLSAFDRCHQHSFAKLAFRRCGSRQRISNYLSLRPMQPRRPVGCWSAAFPHRRPRSCSRGQCCRGYPPIRAASRPGQSFTVAASAKTRLAFVGSSAEYRFNENPASLWLQRSRSRHRPHLFHGNLLILLFSQQFRLSRLRPARSCCDYPDILTNYQ